MVGLKTRFIFGYTLTIVIAALLTIPHVRAGTVWMTLGDPKTTPRSGETFETDLLCSSWNAYLGAYQVTLNTDPSALQIEAITIPEASVFNNQTYFNPDSFSSGQTIITGFQLDDFGWQDPPEAMATIRWRALGPEGTNAQIEIETQSTVDVGFKQVDAQTFAKTIEIESKGSEGGDGGGGCFIFTININ